MLRYDFFLNTGPYLFLVLPDKHFINSRNCNPRKKSGGYFIIIIYLIGWPWWILICNYLLFLNLWQMIDESLFYVFELTVDCSQCSGFGSVGVTLTGWPSPPASSPSVRLCCSRSTASWSSWSLPRAQCSCCCQPCSSEASCSCTALVGHWGRSSSTTSAARGKEVVGKENKEDSVNSC